MEHPPAKKRARGLLRHLELREEVLQALGGLHVGDEVLEREALRREDRGTARAHGVPGHEEDLRAREVSTERRAIILQFVLGEQTVICLPPAFPNVLPH